RACAYTAHKCEYDYITGSTVEGVPQYITYRHWLMHYWLTGDERVLEYVIDTTAAHNVANPASGAWKDLDYATKANSEGRPAAYYSGLLLNALLMSRSDEAPYGGGTWLARNQARLNKILASPAWGYNNGVAGPSSDAVWATTYGMPAGEEPLVSGLFNALVYVYLTEYYDLSGDPDSRIPPKIKEGIDYWWNLRRSNQSGLAHTVRTETIRYCEFGVPGCGPNCSVAGL